MGVCLGRHRRGDHIRTHTRGTGHRWLEPPSAKRTSIDLHQCQKYWEDGVRAWVYLFWPEFGWVNGEGLKIVFGGRWDDEDELISSSDKDRWKIFQNLEETNSEISAVLSLLLEEMKNPDSRLSRLPVEIIQEIYSYIFSYCETHIDTTKNFGHLVQGLRHDCIHGGHCSHGYDYYLHRPWSALTGLTEHRRTDLLLPQPLEFGRPCFPYRTGTLRCFPRPHQFRGACLVSNVTFPAPKGVNCNMMPIRLGNPYSIPEIIKQYMPLLIACIMDYSQRNRIGYITINESIISNDGQCHTGNHTEPPGKIWLGRYKDQSLPQDVASKTSAIQLKRRLFDEKCRRSNDDYYSGGIYMASNVADSTRIWNCKFKNPSEVIGPLGDLQSYHKSYLGKGQLLESGEMVFITDCTPYENLPLKAGTSWQYFQLVTSEVFDWDVDHCSPNPLLEDDRFI